METVTESGEPADSATQRRTLREQIGFAARIWSPYRAIAPLIIVLSLLNAVIVVVYPVLLKRVIDGVGQNLSTGWLLTQIGWLLLYAVLHFSVYFVMQYLRARQNIRFEFTARQWAFEHLLGWGRGARLRFRTGDLVTRMTDDVTDKLSWYLCSGVGRLIEAGAVIITGVAMMLYLNPTLTLYTAGPLPILIGLFIVTASALTSRYQAVQSSISHLNGALESGFSGIRVVKAFSAEAMQRRVLGDCIERQRQAELRAVRWQTVIDSLYGNVWQLGIVGVLLAGGVMVIEGRITLGELVAFDTYVLMLVWPMFDVGQFLVRGRLSQVTVDRLMEVEAVEPEIPRDDPEPIPFRPVFGAEPETGDVHEPTPEPTSVVFSETTYAYPDARRDALQHVTFAATPGTITAVVGEVGAGKSTLLSLVPRLADPSGGEVRLGGDMLTARPAGLTRRRIGWAAQEPELFSGTIDENIRFGRTWVTDEDVRWAVGLAALQQELDGFDDGLNTVLGSRGVRLSGGQKQRVSLARALAGRPSVLLLDDCTASLDAETEERVWLKLLSELPDCTVVVTTHRPETIARADQVVVLKEGRVEQLGTFDELADADGELVRLYRRYRLGSE